MKSLHSLQTSVSIFTDTYRYLQMTKYGNRTLAELKFNWAQDILQKLNVELEVEGAVSDLASLIFVGNHISYLDIPLLMATAKNISFVAKQELKSWPIFGDAAKKTDTVFVNRADGNSRSSARIAVQEAVARGKRVVIFPSGTTSIHEDKNWKKGAFHIAHELGCFIQPFRISYESPRGVAYIDQDFFPVHLYNLCRYEKIRAKIVFHEPVRVKDPAWDCIYWNYWAKGLTDGN
jgi:lyso-ornithine lipid O-acyltransferase